MNPSHPLTALCALALSCAVPLPARSAPRWASDADAKTAQGSTFTCQGDGKSEDDALAAALGICNDKICKVCGVEVESIVETKETLTGVDLQRKIVERCKRVRTHDTVPKYKSSECGPDGCQAWVQILYTKADEQAECPRYQKDDFADPLACEKDIDTFRHTEGRDAASFRTRTRLLDAAIIHCEKIDVRPTPALMALDEKLRAGMDQFEFTEKHKKSLGDETAWMVGDSWGKNAHDEAVDRYKPQWAWYLTTFEPLRQQIAESKLLAQRLKLARDYVANRAIVFEVIEAGLAKDCDTTAGVERLFTALRRAPTGGQYGSPDVHFSVTPIIEDLKTDTQALQAWYRGAYPPEKLDRTTRPSDLARIFAADKKVSADEWAWGLAAARDSNTLCTRILLAVRDHGGEEVRGARFLAAFEQGVQKLKGAPSDKQLFRIFRDLAPMKDPGFLSFLEPKLPAGVRAGLDWAFFADVVQRFEDDQTEDEQRLWLARAAQEAAVAPAGGETDESCHALDKRWEVLEDVLAPLEPLYARTCACLSGPFKSASRWNKWELLERAYARDLPCARVPGSAKAPPVPPKKLVQTLPATPDAGGPCAWREPRPPRVISERPYITAARPLDKDWLTCAEKAGGVLTLEILLQQKDGKLAPYKSQRMRSTRMEEKAWLSDFCGREAFTNTTAVKFVLTGTGAAANASWTSPLVPVKCPCMAQDHSSFVLKTVPEGLSVEARNDPEWLKCHLPGTMELRLFAARTQPEADAIVLPTVVVPGLEKGALKTVIPKAKLCAAGPWVSTAFWATGALSEERNKGNDTKKLDCK